MRQTGRCRLPWLRRARGGLEGVVALLLAFVLAFAVASPASALEPISVDPEQDRIEITGLGEVHGGRGDALQIDTASGPDGVKGRMSVRAATPGTSPSWIVFALHNPTDKPIERWLTAERYTIIGSSIVWPDLDARRIEAVTPSLGYLPDRVKSERADIFRITLEPGQTITYVAELSSDRIPRVYLWKPLEYELKARDRQLFNGIMLGFSGLLAIFLTAVFAANHKAIFPAASLVAWCVLAYLCVDFGFWHKLFQLRPEDNAVYRAATEAAIAASLVIFISVFLRLAAWHGFIRMLASVWIAAQLALVFIAVIDPRLAATFARASFVAIGAIGGLLTLYLAIRGQDRALALIPTWLLLLVWIFAAGVTLTGKLSGDAVVSGLVAGLVLIIVLLGFTVTQFAFRSFEPLYGSAPSELQLRSLAVDGASAAVWEWFARRDEVKVSPIIEATLGLASGELSAKVDDFAKHLHPADRERFRLVLWGVQERNGGSLHIELRMRHADNSYRWFEIEAASVPNADRRALRCVGLMRDITDAKRAQDRLMHDAVHCSLTGLPNRELFLDRLGVAIERAKSEQQVRPTVYFIDIDKFKGVNASLGLIVGDSVLLTVARRLMRHLGPQDTLARVGGDQFAMMLIAEQDPRELALLAERMRRSLRSAIKIAGEEISLTTSTGIAIMSSTEASAADLLKEAEIAMYRAKRGGPDRVEIFRPEMRREPDERTTTENELRRALERNQIRIQYRPVIYLPTEELAGFEAVVRWEHPTLGLVRPLDFVPAAEQSDLVVKLSSHVLVRAAQEAAKWQKELPRGDNPIFVSVNISSPDLFDKDLIQEIRHILGRALVPPGSLRLEIAESVAMDNPEQAVHVLEVLRSGGAGLSIEGFGTGYSSLAYLQRFAFDTVKIDRGLVESSSSDGPGAPIVRSIVALAHEFGKKVIAEGIEVAEDANFLRGLGCDFGQGFYYGEPMSDREALQLLRTISKSERKLQRRGLFRPKVTRRRKKSTELHVASVAAGEGGEQPIRADATSETAASNRNAKPAAPARADAPAHAKAGEESTLGKAAGRLKAARHLLARGVRKEATRAEAPAAASGAESPPPLQPSGSPPALPPAVKTQGAATANARTQPAGNGAGGLPPRPPRTRRVPQGMTAPPTQTMTPPPPPPPPPAQAQPRTTTGQPARGPHAQPPPPIPPAQRTGVPPAASRAVPPTAHPGRVPPQSPQPARASTAAPPRPAAPPAQPPAQAGSRQPPRPAAPVTGAPPPPSSQPAAMPPGAVPPPPMAASAPPRTAAPPPQQPVQPDGRPAVPTSGPGPAAQYPSLPPAIAESLAKLAGVPITEAQTRPGMAPAGARVPEPAANPPPQPKVVQR